MLPPIQYIWFLEPHEFTPQKASRTKFAVGTYIEGLLQCAEFSPGYILLKPPNSNVWFSKLLYAISTGLSPLECVGINRSRWNFALLMMNINECSQYSMLTLICETERGKFIHSFIYFDSGGMAHKNNRQITIDNTRKYRKTDRHIVDKW